MPKAVVVAANVFVSSLGKTDKFSSGSKLFFYSLKPNTRIVIPTTVAIETLVALAKQKKLKPKATLNLFSSFNLVPIDQIFLNQATKLVHKTQLKTADFLVAATASIHHTLLITWDKQLLKLPRSFCQVLTPTQFVKRYHKN